MSKVYILSEKNIHEDEWKIVGVIRDYATSCAFMNKSLAEKGILRRWQSAEFNDPDLLNRIAKEQNNA